MKRWWSVVLTWSTGTGESAVYRHARDQIYSYESQVLSLAFKRNPCPFPSGTGDIRTSASYR